MPGKRHSHPYQPVPWTTEHTVTLLTTKLWEADALWDFYKTANGNDRAAFFAAFAVLLKEKLAAEREISRLKHLAASFTQAMAERDQAVAEQNKFVAELIARLEAIEVLPIETRPGKTLSEHQRGRARRSAEKAQKQREAWLDELERGFRRERGTNPYLTDDEILDLLIGPVDNSWPAGLYHPSRGEMKKGLTQLYKTRQLPRRNRHRRE
jgi:hypothetical protein